MSAAGVHDMTGGGGGGGGGEHRSDIPMSVTFCVTNYQASGDGGKPRKRPS